MSDSSQPTPFSARPDILLALDPSLHTRSSSIFSYHQIQPGQRKPSLRLDHYTEVYSTIFHICGGEGSAHGFARNPCRNTKIKDLSCREAIRVRRKCRRVSGRPYQHFITMGRPVRLRKALPAMMRPWQIREGVV